MTSYRSQNQTADRGWSTWAPSRASKRIESFGKKKADDSFA